MIEWMRRVGPERPFLHAGERTWSYGEAVAEVEARLSASPRLSILTLRPASVFELIAGVASGGITVVGPEPEATQPHDDSLVVFTSGTTGPPKGVRFTELNLTAAASASAQHLGHDESDDWLLAMPLHHVGGISIVVRQAYTGGSVTLLPGFEPRSFADALHGGVTMVSVVPTMLARIIDRGPFLDLKAVLVGGGPIPAGLLESAANVGLPVLPTYGMTETLGQVATLRPGAPLEYKVHPLPGVEVRTEFDGRIAVKGPQVSPGYVGEPDRPDPWLVTNDLGEIGEDGALRIQGRADTVIVSGGENISPERVEAVLRQHPAVAEAVVVGVPDPEWGNRVVAFYVGDAPASDLRDHLASRLPSHMVPKSFISVDELPRTAIGKPDRVAAVELGLGRSD